MRYDNLGLGWLKPRDKSAIIFRTLCFGFEKRFLHRSMEDGDGLGRGLYICRERYDIFLSVPLRSSWTLRIVKSL